MRYLKVFEEFLTESKVIDLALDRIDGLPKGSIFDDAKNIDGIFKRSKHSWSEG